VASTSRRLPILTFHALDDRDSVISCPPRVFRRGLTVLAERGYQAIPLSEAVACLRERRPFPDRAYVLTFDDGFQSVYSEALPRLQELGLPATVFLIAGGDGRASSGRVPAFEGRAMLSWPEMREMRAAGVDFGAHTLTHPDLTRLPPSQIESEMSASKARIEDALGAPVTSFAYPFGRYDERSRRIAQRYFSCACADTLGFLSPASDPYRLERVDGYYLGSDRLFGLMATRLFPWYVTARSVPRRLRRFMVRRAR
jgi:peptidoglycan/xylan/chitin deacetylase (PgdA/CDA1 family)